MKGFIAFIREQGVVGLAVGFILGGAIGKVVSSLVDNIINPLLGLAMGSAGNLSDSSVKIGAATLAWGSFVNNIVDFIVIALVVYFGIKVFKLERLDTKK